MEQHTEISTQLLPTYMPNVRYTKTYVNAELSAITLDIRYTNTAKKIAHNAKLYRH